MFAFHGIKNKHINTLWLCWSMHSDQLQHDLTRINPKSYDTHACLRKQHSHHQHSKHNVLHKFKQSSHVEADRKEVKRWLCSTFNRLIFSFGWCFCWKENLRISAVLLIKLIVTFFINTVLWKTQKSMFLMALLCMTKCSFWEL